MLGVAENANSSAIKKAFYQNRRVLHPDKNAGDPKCKEQFQQVNKANHTLSDPSRRLQHDADLFVRRCWLSALDNQYEPAVAFAQVHLSTPGTVLRAKEIPATQINFFTRANGAAMLRLKRSSGAKLRVLKSALILCAGTEYQVSKEETQIDDLVARGIL